LMIVIDLLLMLHSQAVSGAAPLASPTLLHRRAHRKDECEAGIPSEVTSEPNDEGEDRQQNQRDQAGA
jgi:hypothetical protein